MYTYIYVFILDIHMYINISLYTYIYIIMIYRGQGYAQDGILMNAVDTGWINDENPLERAREIAEQHNFQTPIDEVRPTETPILFASKSAAHRDKSRKWNVS